MLLVVVYNTLRPRSDPVSNDYLHSDLYVEVVLIFLEVKENLVEDLLPHRCQILYQLGFEGGGPCPLARTESMEDIVESDRCPNLAVDYPRHRLPEELYQSNASEIDVPLWN